jgi:hypothetical protein
MVSFLFWNLMGNQTATWHVRAPHLRTRLSRMASVFGVDVLLCVESGFEAAELLAALNQGAGQTYSLAQNLNQRIQVITRLPPDRVVSQFDSADGRLTIRRLVTAKTDLLLAVLHFQSQMNWTPTDQAFQATALQDDLVRTEELVGHRRTVLVGDLNMNPFDPGVAGAQALNAVMTRELAEAEERTVSRRSYRFFYNPMWGHFGDRTPGPPGTYFYSTSAPLNFYWNVFDQVLLRPELMSSLAEVQILDNDGQESLLTGRGRPRSSELSDHLPILFRLTV